MLKKIAFTLLHAAGLTLLAAWWNRKRVIFLCYHGVTERATRSSLDPRGLHIRHHRFAAQLDHLQKRYHVISLSAYLEAVRAGRPLPDYSVVLTFDDGYRNFLTAAAPHLAQRGLPATVFIITNNASEAGDPNADGRWSPKDDLSYLSWAEVQSLARGSGFEFGSHTCSHSRLLTLAPEDTERELRDSYSTLMSHLPQRAPALSYPKGEHSPLLVKQARAIGYACAVTTDRGANTFDSDLFALGRTLIGDDDDEAAFAVRLSGLRRGLVRLGSILLPPVFQKRGGAHQSVPQHAAHVEDANEYVGSD
ncbi:MAG: polysaccharide deacetylase family protein [Pyrinomonadaceae bacterium]|nr:polysaccharide deacetylase family protein [Pyrinomonadaceae bacterium]